MTQTNDPPLISSLELIPDAAEKADLDAPNTSGGKLVIGQAPNITITETTVVADAAERLALDVQEGDVAVQTNVSTSFIFTGGDNVAPNWQPLDFDAVGAISGEDISPDNITALGQISGQSLSITGAINGADTSAAAAGEALTSDGAGGFSFASTGGIETVSAFNDLPAIDPPQFAYVDELNTLYYSNANAGAFDLNNRSSQNGFVTTNTTRPRGFSFSTSGDILFISEQTNDTVEQYSLTQPFDVTTATFDNVTHSTSAAPRGVEISKDGSKMFVLLDGPDEVREFTLTTPNDLSNVTPTGNTLSMQDLSPRGLCISSDGKKLYEGGRIDGKIFQYTMTTPFDLSTASFDNIDFGTGGVIQGCEISPDGTKFLELDESFGVNQYILSTPFEIDTASFDVGISKEGGRPTCARFNFNGTKYFESSEDDDRVYQFDINTVSQWEEV